MLCRKQCKYYCIFKEKGRVLFRALIPSAFITRLQNYQQALVILVSCYYKHNINIITNFLHINRCELNFKIKVAALMSNLVWLCRRELSVEVIGERCMELRGVGVRGEGERLMALRCSTVRKELAGETCRKHALCYVTLFLIFTPKFRAFPYSVLRITSTPIDGCFL